MSYTDWIISHLTDMGFTSEQAEEEVMNLPRFIESSRIQNSDPKQVAEYIFSYRLM